MAKTNEIATKTERVELTNPSDILDFATNLKKMIIENKLYTNIRGKNYINVEGWQIAGAFTGTFPVVESVENLSEDDTFKYRAEVSIRDSEGNKVGSGVAICSNKEPGKTNFDEYAVASMAQTRAVGKAYRLKIGWLLKVAGYETTPAEEMDAVEASVIEGRKDEIQLAKEKLAKAKTLEDLQVAFVKLPRDVRQNESVQNLKNLMKAKFTGGQDESN